LTTLFKIIDEGPLNSSQLIELKEMEDLKHSWLEKEEQSWNLKNRALWLEAGDNNTKYFHQYANFKRNLNTIWDIKDEENQVVISFKEKEKWGKIL
jgi:hypothetical protein